MSRRRFVAQMKNMISHNDIGDALLQVFYMHVTISYNLYRYYTT